jgi:hypothetical protein
VANDTSRPRRTTWRPVRDRRRIGPRRTWEETGCVEWCPVGTTVPDGELVERGQYMKRTLTLVSVFALMLSMLAMPATATEHLVQPDQVLPSAPQGASNEAGYWETLEGETCEKIDQGDPNSNYVVQEPPEDSYWTKIIVKQSTFDYVFLSPSEGDELNTGGAYSHVIVCWKMLPPFVPEGAVAVEKTADGEYDRTVTWDITKSVDPDYHRLLVGGSADSGYEVDVEKFEVSDNYTISGTIEISGLTNVDVVITSIVDSIASATITCPGDPLPTTIAAGGSLECDYTATGDPTVLSNTVEVEGYYIIPEGFLGAGTQVDVDDDDTATFDYTENLIGYDEVDVTDAFAGGAAELLGTISGSYLFEYDRTFVCEERGTFEYPNTATIAQTGQYDDALVTVECVAALEACTPGFWGGDKNSPYTPANQPAWDYLSGLGIDVDDEFADSGLTYNEIFNTSGKNSYSGSLVWHAAAAYLNAVMAGEGLLDFPLTPEQVLDLYEAGDKDALANANEDGECPFGATFPSLVE